MNNILSPNMLKTYQTCPKKYYFQYVERINIPKSALPFEKGKKIHALANYYLQKIKIDRIETALNGEEQKVWTLLKENPFYNMDYVKSEFSLSIKLTNQPPTACGDFPLKGGRNSTDLSYWLGGRIDAVVKNNNDYYILDYKTGSIPKNPEFDPQTMVYLLCVDRYLKTYNSLSFVYIDLKNKQNHVIKFNNDIKSEYEEKLVQYCDTINSDKVYKCSFEFCKYCEYSKICKV